MLFSWYVFIRLAFSFQTSYKVAHGTSLLLLLLRILHGTFLALCSEIGNIRKCFTQTWKQITSLLTLSFIHIFHKKNCTFVVDVRTFYVKGSNLGHHISILLCAFWIHVINEIGHFRFKTVLLVKRILATNFQSDD